MGCGGGLRLTPIKATSNRPSNVVVYFKVENGKEPVGGLTAESFKIFEDGDPISQFESKQTILNPEVAASHYTLLLVDMSGSITDSGSVDSLVEAAGAPLQSVSRARSNRRLRSTPSRARRSYTPSCRSPRRAARKRR